MRAKRWSMWEWTLPSESSPMRWSGVFRARQFLVSRCQASPRKRLPSAMARLTSLAPWSKTRPAPEGVVTHLGVAHVRVVREADRRAVRAKRAPREAGAKVVQDRRAGESDGVPLVAGSDADPVHDDDDDRPGRGNDPLAATQGPIQDSSPSIRRAGRSSRASVHASGECPPEPAARGCPSPCFDSRRWPEGSLPP